MHCCYRCAARIDTDICPECGYNVSEYIETPGPLKPDSRIGANRRYSVCRVLGQGGFGITYLGYDNENARKVAIKEYFPIGIAIRNTERATIVAANSGMINSLKSGVVKFFEESEILSRYSYHRNIVKVYDFFYENETAYMIMEYVDGANLYTLIRDNGVLDDKTTIDVILPIVDALIEIHRDGILHRDISPANILINENGEVKLIDFGAARAYSFDNSNSLSVILKGGYAPIEQYTKHGNQGPWTDVYALCATMYYCVTGITPEQATDRIDDDRTEPPSRYNPKISPALEGIIMHGLAFRSADRIQSMTLLKRDMEACSQRIPVYSEKKQTHIDTYPAFIEPSNKGKTTPKKNLKSILIPLLSFTALSVIVVIAVFLLRDVFSPTSNLIYEAELPAETGTEAELLAETTAEAESEPVSVDIITLNPTQITLTEGEPFVLSATILPENADDKTISWVSSDTNIVEIDPNGARCEMIPVNAGIATVTATASNGKSADCTVTVPFTISETASGSCGSKVFWSLDSNGTLTISGSGEMDNYFNNQPWIENIENIKTVIIEDEVTSIGNYAFYNSGLTSITIPNSVTSIGNQAFGSCPGLTSITISDSVTSIKDQAFSLCSGLTEINVDVNNTSYMDIDGVLFNKDETELLLYPVGKTDKEYTIPDSVTSIGSDAFCFSTTLTNVIIPDSVTSIGRWAFVGCNGITSITVSNNIRSVGTGAFAFWKEEQTIHIKGSDEGWDDDWERDCLAQFITTLSEQPVVSDSTIISNSCGSNTFWNLDLNGTLTISGSGEMDDYFYNQPWAENIKKIKTVIIEDGVTNIGAEAFYDCSKITSIAIPDSVTSIGRYAFKGCSGLTSITLPDSITSIGNWAFFSCTGLTSITIPDSVTNIGRSLFYFCIGLENVTIPNGVTSIGDWFFYNCISLTSITIPDSVTSIGEEAFFLCSGLKSITIPKSVTSIGRWAFYNCTGITSITIPESVTSIGEETFGNWTKTQIIDIEGSDSSWSSDWDKSCSAQIIHK